MDQNQKVLRWNFPTMGTIYIKLLEGYSTKQQLLDTYDKVAGFAGFWYESLFFSHYRHCFKFYVDYIKPSTDEVKALELNISTVVEQHGDEGKLTTGSLHEMRARYPVVDAVGYLQEYRSGRKWLVFIQISLQNYNEH